MRRRRRSTQRRESGASDLYTRQQRLNATMLEVQLRKAEADMEAAKVAFEALGTCDFEL